MTAFLILLCSLAGPSNEADSFPPTLPSGKPVAVESGPELLQPPVPLADGVTIASTPPQVELRYFPGQDYPGKPWSSWGESLFVQGRYYTAIGDHLAPQGNAFVYEYDPVRQSLQRICDVRQTLKLPDGHYTPGKIHSRIDQGRDGWLYFATHRGSTKTTTEAFHYRGDWILRHHPERGDTEVVVQAPVPEHCIPVSITDAQRLIFYGSTQPGNNQGGPRFFAFDLTSREVIHDSDDGPARAIALAGSSGRAYYSRSSDSTLMRFDPATGLSSDLGKTLDIRAASAESQDGTIYTVSPGRGNEPAVISAIDTKAETVRHIGPAAVGSQQYITALALASEGRFLYYVPGAHGRADEDGSPVVRFDTQTGDRHVIAFLAPVFTDKYGVTPCGSYSLALDEQGQRLFITWNARRNSRNWDCCCLTVLHLPKAER